MTTEEVMELLAEIASEFEDRSERDKPGSPMCSQVYGMCAQHVRDRITELAQSGS
jgi:hypothetical protein